METTTPLETPPASPPAGPLEIPEWLSGAEFAEITADESNKNILSFYKTPQDAAKTIVEKEKLLRSGFRLPKKLNDEQIKELSGHIAAINKVPENAEGYKMEIPGEIDKKFDISEKAKMSLRALAKENNFSPAAVQKGYEMIVRLNAEAAAAQTKEFNDNQVERNKETVWQMKQYWGPGEYEGRLDLIEEFAQSRAIDDQEYGDFSEELERTGMKSNALLFKILGDAAKMYSILEKDATVTAGAFTASKGNTVISEETKRAQRFPNTPRSLGGGKPD